MHQERKTLPILRWIRRHVVGGLILSLAAGAVTAQAAEIVDNGTGFGSNPGNLQMYSYIPDSLPASAPLVVVLHGCTQNARGYAVGAGWTKVADTLKFALVMPQENDPAQNGCFKWFSANDNQRDRGEALSIKQMVDKMKADHGVDPHRIFVSGLSGGGAMTSVMLASYPDVFAGGGIIAGLPYGCANSMTEALSCMSNGKPSGGLFNVSMPQGMTAVPMPPGVCLMFPLLCPPGGNDTVSASQWSDAVRKACNCTGPFPIVSIWSGTHDTTVNPINAVEETQQWTGLHGVSPTPAIKDTVKGYPHQVFNNASGKAVVETYSITNMPHGTPIDPGPAADQCGVANDQYVINEHICSSAYIAKFWGLSTPSAQAARRNGGSR